jgi:hypothetical protein
MEAHVPEASHEIAGVPEARAVTHEAERIARKAIVWVSAGVIAFAIVLGGIALLLFEVRRAAIGARIEDSQPQPGRVVSDVRTDLFHPHAGAGDLDKIRQRRDLEHFSWVDREHGILRIPIDTAIDLQLAESPK